MKRSIKVAIIVAVALIAAGLLTVLAAFAVGGFDIRSFNTVTYIENSVTIDIPFDSVSVDCTTADVRIIRSPDGRARVVFSDCDDHAISHSATVRDGELTVTRTDNRTVHIYAEVNIGQGGPTITVYLPQDQYSELDIRTTSGNVDISAGFRFDEAEIHTTSGSIHAVGCTGQKFEGRSSSGTVRLENVQCEEIKAQSSSGGIQLEAVRCLNTEAQSSSGTIRLTDVIATGFIKIHNSSGGVRLAKSDAPKLQIETSSGSVTGSLLTSKLFDITTSSGTVRLPEQGDGGVCEIRTSSGNINLTQ